MKGNNTMKKHLRIAAVALAMATAPAVFAQAASAAPELTLDTQSRAEVENDLMTVTLSVDARGTDVQALTQKAMATLQTATARAKRIQGVEVRVGNVNTYPEWGPKGRTANWNLRADLQLKSTNFAALGTLASELAGSMQINGVYFGLSPAKREAEETRLMNEVATSFKKKATALSQALGYKSFSIKNVNYGNAHGGGGHPMPMRAAMAMEKSSMDMAAVPMPTEGGKSEVTVTLSGTVELK